MMAGFINGSPRRPDRFTSFSRAMDAPSLRQRCTERIEEKARAVLA
jgi:hypothetical protein